VRGFNLSGLLNRKNQIGSIKKEAEHRPVGFWKPGRSIQQEKPNRVNKKKKRNSDLSGFGNLAGLFDRKNQIGSTKKEAESRPVGFWKPGRSIRQEKPNRVNKKRSGIQTFQVLGT